jgi:hypothetical protein|nr:MAG TPA_asm: hypothetical protein [Caudoviricetes sp.]
MRTNEEIQETISKIEERLADIRVNRFVNAPVKEGYLKAVEILRDHQTDITRAKLEELKTVQGRAIAALAIDYLNGECAQYILLGVPIKDR